MLAMNAGRSGYNIKGISTAKTKGRKRENSIGYGELKGITFSKISLTKIVHATYIVTGE